MTTSLTLEAEAKRECCGDAGVITMFKQARSDVKLLARIERREAADMAGMELTLGRSSMKRDG